MQGAYARALALNGSAMLSRIRKTIHRREHGDYEDKKSSDLVYPQPTTDPASTVTGVESSSSTGEQLCEVRPPGGSARHLTVGLGDFVSRLALDCAHLRSLWLRSRTARMASSFAGIRKSASSGSQLVSVTAITGMLEAAGRLVDRKLFALRIDDEHSGRELRHISQSARVRSNRSSSASLPAASCFGKEIERTAREFRLQLFHITEAVSNRDEVRQRSPEPTTIDKVLTGTPSLTINDVLRLFFCPTKRILPPRAVASATKSCAAASRGTVC